MSDRLKISLFYVKLIYFKILNVNYTIRTEYVEYRANKVICICAYYIFPITFTLLEKQYSWIQYPKIYIYIAWKKKCIYRLQYSEYN